MNRPVLTIAGSDSSGEAGIQADLTVFLTRGVAACTVVTGVTAQGAGGVRDWEAVSPELVRAQLAAVLDVDSEQPDAFDETDRSGLEAICRDLLTA